MSAIFNQALSAIKANTSSKSSSILTKKKKVINLREPETKGSSSILDRIKLNKKDGKAIRDISLRRDSDETPHPGIQRKIIRKEKNIKVIHKPTQKGDPNDVWKHDLYEGPSVPNSMSLNCTVFVRNLPDGVDGRLLRSYLPNEDYVIGVRVLFPLKVF